jgi:hypothetical protein
MEYQPGCQTPLWDRRRRMNKRIEELIKEAGTDVSGKWMSIDNVKIFANLLIQECTQTLVDNGFDDAAEYL